MKEGIEQPGRQSGAIYGDLTNESLINIEKKDCLENDYGN
jgi:hypothetical protein